jgi:hypothetical protein
VTSTLGVLVAGPTCTFLYQRGALAYQAVDERWVTPGIRASSCTSTIGSSISSLARFEGNVDAEGHFTWKTFVPRYADIQISADAIVCDPRVVDRGTGRGRGGLY